jgi:transcriptional regulator with XRE-family HTH domain
VSTFRLYSVVMKQTSQVVDANELATRLRERRKAAGMNQGQLSAAAEMPQTTLSQWEQGDVPAAIPAFARVALALQETPNDLLLATPKENELARERSGLPAEIADDMMALTRVMVSMHRKAEAQGPGVSPITLFRQHAESLNDRLLGRKQQPDAPAAGSMQSSMPLDQQIRVHAASLVKLAEELPLDSGLRADVARAALVLGKSVAPQTTPVTQGTKHSKPGRGAASQSDAPDYAPLPLGRKRNRRS